eukprot:TRINITY_DN10840_c0_g1_i1.p2 TRINITY_DN10840_c0_g1~~TRINITY_DN10840_c0_g1_i1.p2  ORF type:complete len:180 (-),score=21.60 TRINITY_DN10840_c0_g1_i1:455-919(-)
MVRCVGTLAGGILLAVCCTANAAAVFVQRRAEAVQGRTRTETGPKGSTAPLTQDGYEKVAKLRSDEDMIHFTLRVLGSQGLAVRKGAEADLRGFVPYYSGVAATQDLSRMREELLNARWVMAVGSTPLRQAGDSALTLVGEPLESWAEAMNSRP